MKLTLNLLSFGLLAAPASAFPADVMERAMEHPELLERFTNAMASISKRDLITADGATAVYEAIPIFNAKAQYIDVGPGSGHEWQAPGPNDLRGPCPGLNAFANHGFLPRNGYASITQFLDATENVVGMGVDLAAFLSVFGAVIDGSGLAWSIGGTPPVSIAGLLGGGNGISGSHNKYESDASPTRPDLYETGNDYETQVNQFQQLIDMSPGDSVTLDSLTKFRSFRFDTQIANNPYFFNGPFTGVAVQPAAYTFIYRFMANHSAENPVGLLSHENIATWFGVSGSSGQYTAKQGYERIPDNWYRRAIEYPYSIPYFQLDLVNAALLYPKFLDVGGNTGTANTFTGVSVQDLTGGALNAQSLLNGNNLLCFAFQFAAQAKPDLLLAPLAKLTSLLGSTLSTLGCPQLAKIDESQLSQFPGYTRSQS